MSFGWSASAVSFGWSASAFVIPLERPALSFRWSAPPLSFRWSAATRNLNSLAAPPAAGQWAVYKEGLRFLDYARNDNGLRWQ